MSTIKNTLPADCLPILPEAELSKVSADEMTVKIDERFGDEETPKANAYRKVASMFASSQKGGIGAPKNVAYWAWRALTDEDETEALKSEIRLAISTQELGAPIYGYDTDALDAIIGKIDGGEELTDEDNELVGECTNLAFKWIDVAVVTKSTRKQKGTAVA